MGKILDYIHRLIGEDDDIDTISLGTDAYSDMIEEWKEESSLSDEDNVHDPVIDGIPLVIDRSIDPNEIATN